MNCPNTDNIYELAYKEATGEVLTDEEVYMKDHFLECDTCKNLFMNYLIQLLILSGETFIDFLQAGAKKNIEQSSDDISDKTQAENMFLYRLMLMNNIVTNQLVLQQCSSLATLIPFTRPEEAASRDLSGSNELRVMAGDSLISYDKEEAVLSVSIDKEAFPYGCLQARIIEPDGVREAVLEDNGFGAWVCEFEDVYGDTSIEIKKL